MKEANWFDFEEEDENKIPIIFNIEDLDDEPILCDDCDHVFLKAYRSTFICPNCSKVYDPRLEHLKRSTRETTIEDATDDTGELSFVENRFTTRGTKIKTRLSKEDEPEFIKQEIENIYHRIGYKHVPVDKKLFPSG